MVVPGAVVRSLRLPAELDGRLRAEANRRHVPVSTLVRHWVEVELSALASDEPISRADAIRAITCIRPTWDGESRS